MQKMMKELVAAAEDDDQALTELFKRIETLDLFSLNETLEDVSTSSLKYLKYYFYFNRVVNVEDRKQVLFRFLDYCDAFQLITKESLERLSNYKQHIKVNREQKIANFKRSKELKTMIEECNDERQKEILVLQLCVHQAIDVLYETDLELEMIEYGKTLASKPKKDTDDRLETHVKREYSGPLMNQTGKVLRPFVITSELNARQELKDGVFKPGHSLPTMSVEEFIDLEISRGNFLSQKYSELTRDNKPVVEADEDDYLAGEIETMRLRGHDEFTDNNPRGWGNRHNKG